MAEAQRKTKRLKTMTEPWSRTKPTAVLVLADGTVIEGTGAGAAGAVEAEVCFNTALTGYQEILTDPSYLGQIVTFTFPHIGNIGANDEDIEDLTPAASRGAGPSQRPRRGAEPARAEPAGVDTRCSGGRAMRVR